MLLESHLSFIHFDRVELTYERVRVYDCLCRLSLEKPTPNGRAAFNTKLLHFPIGTYEFYFKSVLLVLFELNIFSTPCVHLKEYFLVVSLVKYANPYRRF